MNVRITDKEKIEINKPDDLYEIMRRILLRDNKIDREKEHFWMIGLNAAGVILYIELISMGSVKATLVQPMNVFRVAVLKGAVNVMAVHNHPSGGMIPSEADKDITDRLIQVGIILDIKLIDHLIISTETYMSFVSTGLMFELEQSLKYVPPYMVEERIREQEEAKMEKAIKAEEEKHKEKLVVVVTNLLEKQMSVKEIAAILNITVREVQQISKKNKQQ